MPLVCQPFVGRRLPGRDEVNDRVCIAIHVHDDQDPERGTQADQNEPIFTDGMIGIVDQPRLLVKERGLRLHAGHGGPEVHVSLGRGVRAQASAVRARRFSACRRGDVASTRSLPGRDLNLDPGHEHFAVQPARDLGRVGRLKEKFQGLDEIGSRGLDRKRRGTAPAASRCWAESCDVSAAYVILDISRWRDPPTYRSCGSSER